MTYLMPGTVSEVSATAVARTILRRPAGAGAIFDEDGLAERVLELCADYAGEGIDRAARGKRHHDADRLARIDLRECVSRRKNDRSDHDA